VASEDLAIDRIVPSPLDPRISVEVARAVAMAAEAPDWE
jgi:malate dehydrogenase (oxaloacetate-decarboxylating)